MSSMSEDIQCAGSDTRPPMLDRQTFESWQQGNGLRCYALGGTEGAVHTVQYVLESLTTFQLKKRKLSLTFRATKIYFKVYKGTSTHYQHYNDAKGHFGTREGLISGRTSFLMQGTKYGSSGRFVVQDVRGRYNANNPRKTISEHNARGMLLAGNVRRAHSDGNVKVKRLQVQTNLRTEATNYSPGTWCRVMDESVETVREIVEEAKVAKPLDNVLNYVCQYTKLPQELLEYVIDTCPTSFNERDYKAPSTPVTRKKKVTFNDKPGTSSSNTQKHKVHQKVRHTNVHVIHSTGVNTSTEASGSKPRSNTKKNRILPAKSENEKKVEDHPRINKSVWTKVNRVDSSISSKHVVINSNSKSVCKTCNKCVNSANHEMCVVNILSSVNATPTVKIVLNEGKQIWKPKGKLSDNSLNKTKRVWKATGTLIADIGYQWRPTGKKFALGKLNCGYQWRPTGKKFALGKLNCGYQWRPTGKKFALGELCPLTKLSVKCCSKHMTGNRSKLKNFVEKFIGTVRFGNDHFGAIMGYGDYVIGDSVISRVYYVEGLGHNLFSVGQFCDSDLEIAFRKHSCFVRDMNGVDLLKGSRSTNLYTISLDDMMKSSPVCLLSKASKTKSWLWHRRLNHLNFGTINDLARKDLVRGLPRLKFEKDHLCSACQLGKSKKYSHKPKSENTNMEVLHTLHMDLCGPMRVQSINGKKYILVIVDDYSRFTWVKFLRSKDETPEFVINFLKQIQVGLNKTVRYIRTDNGTEFVNQVMSKYYEGVGIFHQKSVPENSSNKMAIMRKTKSYTCGSSTNNVDILKSADVSVGKAALLLPDLTFLRVFGALCYPTNDSEDLGKLQAKADIGIFIGYAPNRKGF
ncbi:retrovirus-related pol polyprotein from transposon TNT 1-94 [Tanacetum coccineum]